MRPDTSKFHSVIGAKRKYQLLEGDLAQPEVESHKRFKPDTLPNKRNKENFAVVSRTDTNLPLEHTLRPLPRLASRSAKIVTCATQLCAVDTVPVEAEPTAQEIQLEDEKTQILNKTKNIGSMRRNMKLIVDETWVFL